MLRIDPTNIATKDLHQFMVSAVAPRPIALVSSIGKNGIANLAPYSFFNAFSSNPPIVIFSSNRRVSNNTTKDTLRNVQETGEVVINMVSHSIVRQMAVASIDYGPEVDEFIKSGFTPLESECVAPFRVAESPVQMECRVDQVLPLGVEGGAGNLVVCQVVRMHISEEVLSPTGRIDPHKIDLMGRLGRMYYVRASGACIEEVPQSMEVIGIGFDGLPPGLLHSKVLTGNQLGQLAGMAKLPLLAETSALIHTNIRVGEIFRGGDRRHALQVYAGEMLDANQLELGAALAVLSLDLE